MSNQGGSCLCSLSGGMGIYRFIAVKRLPRQIAGWSLELFPKFFLSDRGKSVEELGIMQGCSGDDEPSEPPKTGRGCSWTQLSPALCL